MRLSPLLILAFSAAMVLVLLVKSFDSHDSKVKQFKIWNLAPGRFIKKMLESESNNRESIKEHRLNLNQSDQTAIDFVLQNVIRPNYDVPYNLTNASRHDYSQKKEVPGLLKRYFHNMKNGFFLESGAYKGEHLSNSLMLERDFGWSGILVEPLPSNFEALKTVQRKAFALQACLDNVQGVVVRNMIDRYGWGARLASDKFGRKPKWAKEVGVKCVSIAAVLAALNVKHIDWMWLDMEGQEPEVIRSFPFDKVSVDLIQIEVTTGGLRTAGKRNRFYQEFLKKNNFSKVQHTYFDWVYKRNDYDPKIHASTDFS